jgi:hypothetical protein
MAFLLLGGVDVGLTWYPTDFGNREWEFGTVTASFNGMPILILGLTLVLIAGAMARRRWWALGSGVVAAGLTVFVLAAMGLWATNVPLALESVDAAILTGMKKALVKTSVQGVVFTVILAVIAYQGFRAFKRKDPH